VNPPESDQSSNTSAEEWFDGIPSTNTPPTPPLNENSDHKSKIIIIAIVILLAGVIAFTIFMLVRPGVGTCLTASDYKLLTNSSLDTQSSTENFYTGSLKYKNGTNEHADSTKDSDVALIKKIANFSSSRPDNTSIIITISGGYTHKDNEAAAIQRIDSIKQQLIENNVKESRIVTESPSKIDTSSELSENSPELATASIYISIASSPTCK
jgi:hypothetical protein